MSELIKLVQRYETVDHKDQAIAQTYKAYSTYVWRH